MEEIGYANYTSLMITFFSMPDSASKINEIYLASTKGQPKVVKMPPFYKYLSEHPSAPADAYHKIAAVLAEIYPSLYASLVQRA